MVEEAVRDGRRIAQLLASELTGLETGPLADVSVVDADPDAEPTPEGTRAYDVAREGRPVATVLITEQTARIVVLDDSIAIDRSRGPGLSAAEGDRGPELVVERGAAVKRAVDALAETLV